MVRLVMVKVELRDMVDGTWREVLGESEEIPEPAKLVKLAGLV
jgi:hypothetical protein